MRKNLLCAVVCVTAVASSLEAAMSAPTFMTVQGARALGAAASGATINVPPDVTANAPVANTDTINVNAGGTYTANSSFDNLAAGVINVNNGGTFLAGGGNPFTNTGQINVFDGGVLDLQGLFIGTNNGDVEISGPTAQFIGFNSIGTNKGTVTINNGHNFSHGGVSPFFYQHGLLEVKNGSSFDLSGVIFQNNFQNPNSHVFVDATSSITNTSSVLILVGSMRIDGTLEAVAVTMFTNTVLDGNGQIVNGLMNSGTLRPGTSTGTFTIGGQYTQDASGTAEFEINGPTPGTDYDQVIANGGVSLDGTLKLDFDPNTVLADGLEWVLFDVTGPLAGRFDTIITSGLTPADIVLNDGSVDQTILVAQDGPWSVFLHYGYNQTSDVVLTVEIPEPAALAMLGLGGFLITHRRRHR